MFKENLFEKITDLQVRFRNFFQHRKKVAALENYAEAVPVGYHDEIKLIKACMSSRFLSQKGADFLEELLEEHHVNYLDWAYRTKWLKKEIASRKKPTLVQTTFFDLPALRKTEYQVPVELLTPSNTQLGARV